MTFTIDAVGIHAGYYRVTIKNGQFALTDLDSPDESAKFSTRAEAQAAIRSMKELRRERALAAFYIRDDDPTRIVD